MIICALRLIANNYLFCIYFRNDRMPVERRAHRNSVQNVGTPQHPHDTNLRQNHSGESEPRYGKTVAAYRANGEFYLSNYLKMNVR